MRVNVWSGAYVTDQGLILTGSCTGSPVDEAPLDTVRQAVGSFPVFLGSGLDLDNAPQLWRRCDGAIVGTSLKRLGRIDQPVDVERVRELRRVLDRSG